MSTAPNDPEGQESGPAPHPYCLECDEPLDWCIHGDGSGWANCPVPEIRQRPDQRP